MKFNILLAITLTLSLHTSCTDEDVSNSNTNTGGCAGGQSKISDINGNVYNVVQIGNQCWMKENLRTNKYRNGDNILRGLPLNNPTGGLLTYDNPLDESNYGKIYNYYAVTDPRGLCPAGWHVPNDTEWKIMIKSIDPSADTSVNTSTANQIIRSNIAGGMMKTTGSIQGMNGLWESPNIGASNSSGFTGLPGGVTDVIGNLITPLIGKVGSWWSSSLITPNLTVSLGFLWHDSTHFAMHSDSLYTPADGASVRCIRD